MSAPAGSGMVLLAALAGIAAPSRAGGGAANASRVRAGTVELVGPLESATFERGGARSRVHASLRRGERLRVEVPFAALELARDAQPGRVSVAPAGGSATFLAWTRGREWPASLLGRPRPPLENAAPRPSAGALAAALGVLALVLAARRRARVALALGALGAGALALGPWAVVERPGARVLEGGAEGWVAVDAAAGALELAPDPAAWIESAPAAAGLAIDVTLSPAGVRWRIAAPGATLWSVRAFDPGALALEASANRWAALAAVWTRAPGGAWRDHGAWPLDEPLAPERGPGAPPGWLATGLRSDLPALVGRFASRTSGGAEPVDVWIRAAGPGAWIGADRR